MFSTIFPPPLLLDDDDDESFDYSQLFIYFDWNFDFFQLFDDDDDDCPLRPHLSLFKTLFLCSKSFKRSIMLGNKYQNSLKI